MKKIVIGILLALLIIIPILFIFFRNSNSYRTYECKKEQEKNEYGTYQEIIKFKVDKDDKIIENIYFEKRVYNKTDDLNEAFNYYKTNGRDMSNYEIDKKNKTILYSEKAEKIFTLDKNKNKQDKNGKEYLESLKKEYVCIKK